VVGAIFAVLALRFPDGYGLTPASLHLSFLTDVGFSIGPAGRKPRSWCASG
jgi:phospho-N-acetylmuramoyl-pentapeptide-transferase